MKEVLLVCTNFILTLLFPLLLQTSSFLKHFVHKKHRIYKIILNTKIKNYSCFNQFYWNRASITGVNPKKATELNIFSKDYVLSLFGKTRAKLKYRNSRIVARLIVYAPSCVEISNNLLTFLMLFSSACYFTFVFFRD